MVWRGHFCNSDLHPPKKAMSHQETFLGGYAIIVYLRENACQAFFVGVIVIFGICVASAGTALVRQWGVAKWRCAYVA